jgi:hypothetical protein
MHAFRSLLRRGDGSKNNSSTKTRIRKIIFFRGKELELISRAIITSLTRMRLRCC